MDSETRKILLVLMKVGILVLSLVALYLIFILLFPLLGKVLSYIPKLFLPFIIAVLLALLIEPVVNFFETRLRFKRNLAVITSLLLVIGGFVYLVSALVATIIRQLSSLYRMALSHSDQITNQVISSFSDLRLFYLRMDLPAQVEDTLQSNLQKLLEWGQELMSSSINVLVDVFTMLPGLLVFLMIATVATYFIIKDRALIRSFVIHIMPRRARTPGREVITELLNAFTGFLKAYSTLIFITFILTLVALKILGIKYALTLALIIGIMDILPVLGPGTIYIPWIIWELSTGNTFMGISLTVTYIIISAVRQFLEPKIVGDNIGLHPLATLISLYAGLRIGGVVGMIMGPVCVVIFIAIYRTGVLDRFDWRKDIE